MIELSLCTHHVYVSQRPPCIEKILTLDCVLKELEPARNQGALKAILDATESISAGHTGGSLRKEKKLLET